MLRPNSSLLTLMLCACWGAALLYPAPVIGQSTTATVQQSSTAGDRLVANDYYQFSLSVPQGWLSSEGLSKKDYFTSRTLIDDDAPGWVFAYFPPDYEESHVYVELIVSEQNFPRKYLQKQARQLKKNHEDQFRQFLPDAELLEFTVIEEEERNALSFDLLLPYGETSIRQSHYLASGPRFDYQLRVSRREDGSAELQAQLRAIIASFETPPPVYRVPEQRDPWKYYVFPALFFALVVGLVIRAWSTTRRLREE